MKRKGYFVKKIGKMWFHPMVSATPVALFFALALIGSALFAVLALIYLVVRYPLQFPKKLGEMVDSWKDRVD
jgi:hypothetical protein